MNTATIDRPLTYEEERGKPMPSRNHGFVQSNLNAELSKHREYRVGSELDVVLEGRKFVPDLCLYRRQPIDLRHDVLRETEPPLLAVEIFSPTQGSYDVLEKVDAYLRNGVKSCWVVLPPQRLITIYLPDGSEHSYSESGIVTDPATGVTADLAAVFA